MLDPQPAPHQQALELAEEFVRLPETKVGISHTVMPHERIIFLFQGRARGPGDYLFEERPDGRFPRIREVRMGLAPRLRGRRTDPGPMLRP